jgi:hypothetical protein
MEKRNGRTVYPIQYRSSGFPFITKLPNNPMMDD